MKKLLIISTFALITFALTGCTTQPTEKVSTDGIIIYDANSRKDIIPYSCQSFNDGCNQCNRIGSGDEATCTKMFCEVYAEPVCTDTPQSDETNQNLDEETTKSIYIGLSIDEATTEAAKRGVPFRIIEIDGQPQAVTMDLRPGRLNAIITSGFVTDLSIEGGVEIQ